MASALSITVAIPTYRREQVLIATIDSLLGLDAPAAELLVVDQTPEHLPHTGAMLRQWNEQGRIRWLRRSQPSITAAMNQALLEARQDVVLFLDDDIVPFADLVRIHADAHRDPYKLVAGRVLQPWDADVPAASWGESQFASTEVRQIDGFMGGNFSLCRNSALAMGGFDENFVRAAYNFEREFADRWRGRGGKIHFCPGAAIRHLKAPSGGTRTYGDHLTTLYPAHSVGAYYYLLRSRLARHPVRDFLLRPFRAVTTRHHLRRPWWIPVTLASEITGMIWASMLYARGPRYCTAYSAKGS
jgi:glycosyltransferase involved in cell wall biosynthesis